MHSVGIWSLTWKTFSGTGDEYDYGLFISGSEVSTVSRQLVVNLHKMIWGICYLEIQSPASFVLKWCLFPDIKIFPICQEWSVDVVQSRIFNGRLQGGLCQPGAPLGPGAQWHIAEAHRWPMVRRPTRGGSLHCQTPSSRSKTLGASQWLPPPSALAMFDFQSFVFFVFFWIDREVSWGAGNQTAQPYLVSIQRRF